MPAMPRSRKSPRIYRVMCGESTTVVSQAPLIEALQRPGAYPHAAGDIELFETHISWVLLAGDFAYKVKKAVKLEFLDFSTLELRRHFCEEEMRLNRRWAPEMYLGVVPICGTAERPIVDGRGDVIEYALKMMRFPQRSQLDHQLDEGLVSASDMRDLAGTIARYHEEAPPYEFSSEIDALDHVCEPMLDNFEPLEGLVDAGRLERLKAWTDGRLAALEGVLIERRQAGFVRECHADLHLSNLVRLPSGIAAYDCVEFAPELRNVDVISDLSFLVMDLLVRDRRDLAFELVNRYLECSGDYAGLAVFGLYVVYHCLIRAKIAAIRSGERSAATEREGDLAKLRRHVDVAIDWLDRPTPMLVAMHGFSGSGKTWLSGRLVGRLPAIRLRSDIERKRLHGLAETASSSSGLEQGIYTPAATRGVYETLLRFAGIALGDGHHVIVDASFLEQESRSLAAALGREQRAPLVFVDTVADARELERRLACRGDVGADASEAGQSVLQHQLQNADPLTVEEEKRTVRVVTSTTVDPNDVIARIEERRVTQSVQ